MARTKTAPGPAAAVAAAASTGHESGAGAALLEKLPGMADDALGTLGANAERLAQSGTPKRQMQAQAMLPAIQAEIAARRERKAAEAPRRSTGGRRAAKAKTA
ncbi:MAG TPA: hypothetical protein VK943_12030 [Arenibaculum sp.]|nr:hypothetical protein [Arenibaculum sp.]